MPAFHSHSFFVLLRLFNGYGDPRPWTQQNSSVYTLLAFLNVTKNPISLHFAAMTLGPGLIALAVLENARGRFVEFVKVYGNSRAHDQAP